MKEYFKMEWREHGKEYFKEVKTKEFLELMEGLRKAFDTDNEITTQLVRIIPKLVSIQINKDRNEEKDVPCIHCTTEDAKNITIDIRRHHKIVWTILDRYTEKTE